MQTISVTAYLAKIIASHAKNSVVLAMIIRFLLFIKTEYIQSKFYKLIVRAVAALSTHYNNSFFKKYMENDGILQKFYESSFIYTLLSSGFKFASKVLAHIFDFIKKLASGGFLYSASYSLIQKPYVTYTNVFALFLACMIVCPHEIWNNLYAVATAFVFLGIYMIRAYKNLENPSFKKDGLSVVVFTLFVGVSFLYAYNKADALRIVLFVYSALIFSFIIRHSLNTKEKYISVLKILSIGAFVTSVIGIIQRFYGVEVNPEYVDVLTNASMPGRVFSTFANPNNFAELLVLIMPSTAALILISTEKKERYLWTAFLVVDFIAIGMSYSRSCWVALAIAAVIMLLVYDWKLLIPCAVVFLIVLPFLPESITDRILTIGSMKDTSNASRFYIWDGAWKLIKEYFVSGVGAGPLTFKEFYLPVANPLATTSPHSHMLYMEIIIEFGIVAFIGFIAYVLSLVKKAFSSLKDATKEHKAIAGALLGSVFGMLFVFLVEYVWFYPRDMFVYWVVLGLLSVLVNNYKSDKFFKKR